MSESASLDAQALLAHVLGASRAWVLAHPEAAITAGQARALEAALARLEAGEPLPYVLGRWEFYGLDFIVTPATLIPRPETELLVEQALAWLEAHPAPRRALDVGAGTGCIGIALAVNAPRLDVLASDCSLAALRVARGNAQRHGVATRVRFVQADLLPPVAARFDLICANLPYIPSAALAGLRVSRWEPGLALDGGQDGLALIRRLLQAAPTALAEGGLLLLEIEASQGAAARNLARGAFPAAEASLLRDLAGKERLLKMQI
ncbi:MAG: peptide chain release factor N(5)-glutamine methyltransferase [Anaerolineales bacterium]|nr:peptide chain release factor N(5)-glutamine methyltransferase [Anaerolineales bacterium]